MAEQKNAPELPIGRFLKSKSLGGNRVILVVRQPAQTCNGSTLPMAIKVSVNEWKTKTRPCDFSLSLTTERGGAVFADFELDCENCVTFRRVSFDGYGCYETNGECTRMSAGDSDRLISAIRLNEVNNEHVHDILLRYFEVNRDFLWRDALIEHRLIDL